MADWITVATYLLAALLSALAATEASRRVETREQTVWSASSFMLVVLGINELLDVQTLLTSVGRAHARANDWYQHRRDVQLAFVISLAVIVAMAGLAMLWLTRRTHPAVRLAQAGLAFVMVYVLIRAASF